MLKKVKKSSGWKLSTQQINAKTKNVSHFDTNHECLPIRITNVSIIFAQPSLQFYFIQCYVNFSLSLSCSYAAKSLCSRSKKSNLPSRSKYKSHFCPESSLFQLRRAAKKSVIDNTSLSFAVFPNLLSHEGTQT